MFWEALSTAAILRSLSQEAIQSFVELANSNFFTSLAGAAAGAYGGQYIVKKEKIRSDLAKELRNTNATTTLVAGIVNEILGVKHQHTKPLKENFDAQRKAFDSALQKRKEGGDGLFEFQADFQILSVLEMPTQLLQNQAFDKISLNGRALALTSALVRHLHLLNSAIQARNSFVDGQRERHLSTKELVEAYFGVPDGRGRRDETYSSSVQAIYLYTDDCIFYGSELCRELIRHAEELAKRYGKRGVMPIARADFQKAADLGLMPDGREHAEWMKAFGKMPTKDRRYRVALLRLIELGKAGIRLLQNP